MLEDFVCLKQPAGSNSCLPTAVRAILLSYGYPVSPEEASEWCVEGPLGCWFDLAMDGLRAHELTVTELSGDVKEEIRQRVNDPDDPVPALLTIQDPFGLMDLDHAVVVVWIGSMVVDTREDNYVFFMDPSTGEIERELSEHFWQMWDYAGRRGVVIDPP